MRDHDDGGTLAIEPLQQVHDLAAVLGVEIAGGFVGENQRRIGDHRPRHRDALLLAARELRRAVAGAVGDADLGQDRRHPRTPFRSGDIVIEQREFDVLEDAQFVDQVKALEDEADVALA